MPHPSGAISLQTLLPCTQLCPVPPPHIPLPKLVFDFLPIIQFLSIPWTFLALKSSALVLVSEVLTSSRTLLPAALLLYAIITNYCKFSDLKQHTYFSSADF